MFISFLVLSVLVEFAILVVNCDTARVPMGLPEGVSLSLE